MVLPFKTGQNVLSSAHLSPVNEAPDDDGHDTIPAIDYQPRHQNNLAEIPSNLRVGFVDLPAADSDEGEETSRFLGKGKED
jgi:hypothetical protein